MGNLDAPFEKSDLVKCLDIRRKTGMNAENAALNHCSDAQVIKNFGAVLPGVRVSILSHNFVVETVDCCDLTSFMIASKKCNRTRVSSF